MTIQSIPEDLTERVHAHLNSIAPTRRILWTGKSSIVVHFTTDLHVVSMDTRFEPLMLNWTQTFRSPDGAIYLNVPAAWRRVSREAGEGESMKPLTPYMIDLLAALYAGASANEVTKFAYFPEGSNQDPIGFAANTLTGLKMRGLIEADMPHPPGWWKISDEGKRIVPSVLTITQLATINRPLIDPTAPLPANEITNADEPHDDIGTGIDPEPANNLPDVQPADPYAWATPERHAEVQPISEKLLPLVLRPTKEDGVWLIEDATTEKTMRRGLNKFGVTILSVEEGESVDENTEGEPYTIARFTLGRTIETPYPSKRQTKPVAMPDSLYAQYDALHATLPVATQLLIQANGDEWVAFQMDAMLLRRYAPLCRFAAQTVNNAGEQWDKLTVPAGVLDELVTLATEGGLTVALASIVRDEAGALPVREVTEIHTPGQPVQYVGKEEPPTEWETEADADSEPQPQSVPNVEPAAPSKLELTPELQAAKIKLDIVGRLRLGLVESVTPMPHDGWFAVTFVHGLTETFTVPALKTAYEVGDVWRSKRTVYVREQQTAPHGDANAQADAVIAALDDVTTSIVDAFASLAGELDRARTALDDMQTNADLHAIADLPTPYAEAPAVSLLDEAAERDLIAALMRDYPDLNAAAFGTTQFLLNVIATLRAVHPVAAPY